MSQHTFESILDKIVEATLAANKAGKTATQAFAESLADAAAKLESGAIRVDNAVLRAQFQQRRIETERAKLRRNG